MPELPEVESTRRHLEPVIVGRRITGVEVARARMVRRQETPADFAERLTGRTIGGLRRHGKFLIADLSGDVAWVTHLGMSGRVSMASPPDPRSPHTNVVVSLDDGAEVRLVDPRTYGFVAAYLPDELAASPLGGLGPDALTDLPTAAALGGRLAGRTAPVKALLLDQGVLAGVGTIYADEALHRAGIDPLRPGGSLDLDELKRLRRAIRITLAAGLRWGGTSLEDNAFLLPDGRTGEFAARLRVYGREGEPCPVCATPIRRTVVRARGTHWCPTCQR
jgi:formamidopyrimidine-DNA glycosylase